MVVSCAAWAYEPSIVRYHYFYQKEQFELASQTVEDWSAFAIEKGEFTYDIGGESGTAGVNTFVLCPPHIDFGRTTDHPITFHFFVFRWLNHQGEPMPADLGPQAVKLLFQDVNRLSTTFSQLRNTLGYSLENNLQLWRNHLLSDIFRQYYCEQYVQAEHQPLLLKDPLMDYVQKTIEEQLGEPIRIEDIAYSIGLSPVQLSRRYRRSFGINPSEHLIRCRLKKVCELLIHSNCTIEEIADRCGFSNGFYLSRLFSARMNMSPSQYRKNYLV